MIGIFEIKQLLTVLFVLFLLLLWMQMRRDETSGFYFLLFQWFQTARPLVQRQPAHQHLCCGKSFGFSIHLAVKLASRVCLCCCASDYNHTRQVPVVLYASACCYFRGQSSGADSSHAQSVQSHCLPRPVNNARRSISRKQGMIMNSDWTVSNVE